MQIIPSLGVGGIERGVLDISRYLDSLSIENHIFCENYNPNLLTKTEIEKIITTQNESFKSILGIKKIKKQLKAIVKKYNINLIHVSSRAPAFFLNSFIKKLPVKYVTSFHNPYKKENFLKKFYNSFLLKGDIVIANSYFTKKHIQLEYNKNSNIFVVQRGTDIKYFNPDNISVTEINNIKNELNIKEEEIVFMIPSRISSWKGHPKFLEYIFKINLKNNEKFKILFFSNNDFQKNNLYKIAKKFHLINELIILNESQNIRNYYFLSDIIISMSLKEEGFGRTISEALAMKKIVIAPKQGGTKEQLEKFDNNLLFVPNNLHSFENAIKYAIKNKDNNIELRRKYIVSNFSLEDMLSKTLSLYEK